jgi:hypothetical protein
VIRVGVLAEHLAGSADGPRYRCVVYVLTWPKSVEKLFLEHDPVVVLQQVANGIENLRLERDFEAGPQQLVSAGVELEVTEKKGHRPTLAPPLPLATARGRHSDRLGFVSLLC